jgi:hypothetical protein
MSRDVLNFQPFFPYLLGPEVPGLGISNDGQLLYFTVSSSGSDIWLLDLQDAK